ncbi:MAG: SRPBCC family protein [Candidatus Sericytochromatia bacterium]|nr:SRPBCC family protein [Candidatus Sericytochromatia bacterium]
MKPLEMIQANPNEICVKRGFDAPLELVWRAFTEPEFVKRWLTGPPGHTMPICEIDLREGGQWRYVWNIPVDEMIAYGSYQEVVKHQRIVNTETFAQWPDDSSVVTTLFEQQKDQTLVTMLIAYGTEATRNMVLQTGMTEGIEMSYERLDALMPVYSV